jgi:hypothetical protein
MPTLSATIISPTILPLHAFSSPSLCRPNLPRPPSKLTNRSSGQLNAKHRDLLEMQALVQRRLKASRANFQDGLKAAKEVQHDLEWTSRKVSSIKSKAERVDGERLRRVERRRERDDY